MKTKSKNPIIRLLTIVVFSIVLFACGGGGSSSGSDAEIPQEVSSVLVAGDSISTGFNLATPWPTRLANMLGIAVDNSNSVDGVPTSFGLGYLESEILRVQPTHVIIFLGTNDAIRGSASEAIANLQQMVNIANSQNVNVIIATLPVITTSNSQNDRAAEISNAIRGFSGAQIADIRSVIGDGSGLLADGIHPNGTGQQLIADTMAGFF